MPADFKFKQVIVIRRDLDMGKGKMIVQASHASVSASEKAKERFRQWWEYWQTEGQSKVAVRVENEAELLALEAKAREMGLPAALIRDAGLTQLEPGTVTCLAIGPAPSESVDKITGELPLL